MESILITGASGFIGSFIVEEALKRKFGVWAGVRSSSSREYLRDRKIHFLELDFAHPNELRAQLSGHKGTYNKFDYIVHCAGVTKCVDKNEFDLVNYLQTKYFIDTLRELNMIPKQFIFISTLSVFGPVRERTYDPIMESDPPSPNTAYGLSKLKTELYLQSIPGFPYVIYRPTGVYGPREKDYYLMAKSIRQHTDFSVGFCRQDLTFVYVKVFGPVRERTYDPIMESDPPSPNTAYGLSKLKTELYLQSIPGFPYVIYRPTGVYGPREKDYYLMAKSIRQHTDFSVGFCRQDLTFVYVKDIVQAVFLGIEKQVSRRAYFLADGKVYSSRAFSDLIRKELGNPFVIRLRCPLIVLKVVSLLAEFWAKRQNKTSTLNSDKYRIMKQRNWQCDITPAVEELGFSPEYDLERGVKETIAWYKDKGWL